MWQFYTKVQQWYYYFVLPFQGAVRLAWYLLTGTLLSYDTSLSRCNCIMLSCQGTAVVFVWPRYTAIVWHLIIKVQLCDATLPRYGSSIAWPRYTTIVWHLIITVQLYDASLPRYSSSIACYVFTTVLAYDTTRHIDWLTLRCACFLQPIFWCALLWRYNSTKLGCGCRYGYDWIIWAIVIRS